MVDDVDEGEIGDVAAGGRTVELSDDEPGLELGEEPTSDRRQRPIGEPATETLARARDGRCHDLVLSSRVVAVARVGRGQRELERREALSDLDGASGRPRIDGAIPPKGGRHGLREGVDREEFRRRRRRGGFVATPAAPGGDERNEDYYGQPDGRRQTEKDARGP